MTAVNRITRVATKDLLTEQLGMFYARAGNLLDSGILSLSPIMLACTEKSSVVMVKMSQKAVGVRPQAYDLAIYHVLELICRMVIARRGAAA
ncbi:MULTISPECIES: hypothetical protein [unclassified Microbulbifer]|uniref:hypothetical protein n=1 Tax=unclassified Microbulbifer TaxID=2619833 RepID=UPI0027E4732E|nr:MULTISPECIES: hypothetical protein [unclassified Microbulbifer]